MLLKTEAPDLGSLDRVPVGENTIEFYLKRFDFLYLDPRYRITDSHVAGPAPSASLTIMGPLLTFSLINERDRIQISAAPAQLLTRKNHSWPCLIKQYVDNDAQIRYLPAADEALWMRENLGRVEKLFSDASPLEATCDELSTLRRAGAESYWSSWREQRGLT
ncbi:hypothetical protein [Mycobacterium sp. E2733]|uniref:hypothetical protein n=1 Tax=Mycobacterium sp. E2733 TaxID=1834138 RepID=UPI000A965B3F|nr:hypothetical protein [Mycobacterium sp. E2733]